MFLELLSTLILTLFNHLIGKQSAQKHLWPLIAPRKGFRIQLHRRTQHIFGVWQTGMDFDVLFGLSGSGVASTRVVLPWLWYIVRSPGSKDAWCGACRGSDIGGRKYRLILRMIIESDEDGEIHHYTTYLLQVLLKMLRLHEIALCIIPNWITGNMMWLTSAHMTFPRIFNASWAARSPPDDLLYVLNCSEAGLSVACCMKVPIDSCSSPSFEYESFQIPDPIIA